MAKQKEQTEEVIEIVESTSSESSLDLDNFVEKNKKNLSIIGIAIVAIGAIGFFGYQYMKSLETDAELAAYKAEYTWGTGDNKAASKELAAVVEEHEGTKAGDRAALALATIRMEEGKYEEAIELAKKFDLNDAVIQAKAFCLIGDANMELKNYDEAISYYSKASEYKPNKELTPRYLVKLAIAQEEAGKKEDALATYTKVSNDYMPTQGNNMDVAEAKKGFARLSAELGK